MSDKTGEAPATSKPNPLIIRRHSKTMQIGSDSWEEWTLPPEVSALIKEMARFLKTMNDR